MISIKKIPKFIWVIAAFIVIIGMVATAFVGRIMFIKTYGIDIKPTEKISPKKVEYFLQNDERWKDEYLGNSNYKIGSSGCLLSIIASACNDLGYKTNPQDLNKLLTENGGYTSSGDLLWYKINETVPNIVYDYKRVFDSNTIMEDLKNGYLPIVMVKYHGSGYQHWVLIAASTEDDFLIVDPLNRSKELVPLKTHGRVYYYRVLKNR